jgi:hypothetical protein
VYPFLNGYGLEGDSKSRVARLRKNAIRLLNDTTVTLKVKHQTPLGYVLKANRIKTLWNQTSQTTPKGL